MKLFRKILRYWIGIASVLSFMGGGSSWRTPQAGPIPVSLIIGNSADHPAQPASHPGLRRHTSNGMTFFSTSAPSNNVQPIQPVQPSQVVPLLRTRGS